jgi:type II secretory ATPase GspE/PulE/Tfp pilus assembly ATPase PilB-like protein
MDIPSFEDIDLLAREERKAIMVVREGKSEDAPVEVMLRNIFVWAIITGSSDVHIGGRGDRQEPMVHITIRTPKKLVNLVYQGERGRHFEAKMFSLTATAQGGSTPEILSTRFAIRLPAHFARKHGLRAIGDRPYLVSIRVEYVRTYDGFKFVCRLLDQQKAPKLDELGMSFALLQTIKRVLGEPSGLILVSGPTGSGKTTVLNALMGELNNGQRSIVTAEHPVEFQLEGEGPIAQIEVGGDITFPRALRSTLRLDPDVILVGEIRDTETMEIALQAARTGHLVLATVHANSAAETFARALDLTLDKRRDAYRLAETVKLVLAQRLLDRYEGVATERDLGRDEAAWLSVNGLGHIKRIKEVESTSKQGKAALIEAISMTPGIKDVIRAEALNSAEIYRLACDQLQYETLATAGIRAVQGLGCRIRDCMTCLESTTDAEFTPGLRSRLAQEHELTLVQVADAIDAFCRAMDEGHQKPLDEYLEQARTVQCVTDRY